MKKQTTKKPAKTVKPVTKPVDNKKSHKEEIKKKAVKAEAEISTEMETVVETVAPTPAAVAEATSAPVVETEKKIRLDGSDFDGPVENLEKIVVGKHVANLSYMQHLPVPLTPDEIVFVHPVQEDVTNGYVRIIHGEQKRVSTFSYMTLNGPPARVETPTQATQAPTTTEHAAETTAIRTPKSSEKAEKPKSGVVVNGVNHSKSGAVLAIVKDYCEKHPGLSIEQLKAVFPDTLLRRFGIFQEVAAAKKIANGGNRYFFKDEQQITLADGKVAVCNQITSENIKPMLDTARTLGYEITVNE